MFRIEFFVDDKKLVSALNALVGIAHGQPNVAPVINVKKKANGALVAKTEGSTMDRFAVELKKRKGKPLVAADIKAMMAGLGLSPASYSTMLTNARKAGLVKKTGKGGPGNPNKYVVL